MKNKILTFAFFAAFTFSVTSCNSDDDGIRETQIEYSALPESSKTLIDTYFPGATTSWVIQNSRAESDGTLYEITLSNGFEIDFAADGTWTDIDGNVLEVPTGLVPTNIATYVQANYPSPLIITGIDKENYGYQVELSSDLDLIFDTEGNFLRIDND